MPPCPILRPIQFVDDADQHFLRNLPSGTRKAIAEELRRMQRREPPLQFRPLKQFGSGVGELKRGGVRVVVSMTADPNAIWIVCSFDKDSSAGAKMKKEHKDQIEAALRRLRQRIGTSKRG